MVNSPSPVTRGSPTSQPLAVSQRSIAFQHVDRALSPAVSISPSQPLDASEGQSELQVTLTKKGRLSRRATFAPDVVDLAALPPSLTCSMRRPPALRKESASFLQDSALSRESTLSTDTLSREHSTLSREHSTLSREHSTLSREHSTLSREHSTLSRDSSLLKEPIPRRQTTLRKEGSLYKDSTLKQQASTPITSTDKIPKRDHDTKLRPAPSSSFGNADAIGHGKSISHTHKPHKLGRKASLAPAKPQKMEDVLGDFKLAVERKARMGTGSEGEHAQGLESAFKELAVNWIANAFVEAKKPGDAFLTAMSKAKDKTAARGPTPPLVHEPSATTPSLVSQPSDAFMCSAADDAAMYGTSILAPSDRKRLRKVVALPTAERDDMALEPVMRVLQKVEFTAGLETAVLKGIARFVVYESFPSGYTVVRQGDPGALFYIILSGSVAINVATDTAVKTVRTLDAGQAFGELALLKQGGRRAASVVTTSTSELLTIDGKQYQELLAHLQRDEIKAKVEVLRRAPMFRGWSMGQLHSLAALVQLQRLPYNTVVVEQGSKADATYFIKVGEVRVVKRVECSMPFYERLQKDALQAAKYAPSSESKYRFQSEPYVHLAVGRDAPMTPLNVSITSAAEMSHIQPAQPQEAWLEVMTYGQFESFGEAAALEEGTRAASIITTMYTELLVLTKHDLLSHISAAAKERLEETIKQRTPDLQLMRSVRSSVMWDRYKHNLVQDILWCKGKQDRLIEYTDVLKMKGSGSWK